VCHPTIRTARGWPTQRFAVGPVAEPADRELMYHKPEHRVYRADQHRRDRSVNLVKFTDGVELTFPSTIWPRRIRSVVEDPNAFRPVRPSLPITGITPGVSATQASRSSFRRRRTDHQSFFDDGWYKATTATVLSVSRRPAATRTPEPKASGSPSTRRPRLRRRAAAPIPTADSAFAVDKRLMDDRRILTGWPRQVGWVLNLARQRTDARNRVGQGPTHGRLV
jgi:hypothetical protein